MAKDSGHDDYVVVGRLSPIRSLLKHVAVLFLEPSQLLHVEGLELALGFLFVGRQLLLLHGLQTNRGIVADTYNEDASALALVVFALLVGEGDVDFRDVVGRVRRRAGVLQHGLAVAADKDDAGAAIVLGLNGEAVLPGVLADLVVDGQGLCIAGGAAAADAAEEEEGRDEDEGEEGDAEDGNEGVDHGVGAVVRVGVGATTNKATEGLQAGPLVALNDGHPGNGHFLGAGSQAVEDGGHGGYGYQYIDGDVLNNIVSRRVYALSAAYVSEAVTRQARAKAVVVANAIY